MKHRSKILVTIFLLVFSFGIFAGAAVFAQGTKENQDYMSFSGRHAPNWKLRANKPLIIGGYGDNFAYSGKNVRLIEGSAVVDVNTKKNTGSMEVTFNGTITPEKGKTYTGEIKIVYNMFMEGPPYWEGGVADFVYLHGDTKQEAPVMPKVKTYLASWGPADIYVNGELVYKGLAGHMMYTERSRDVNTYAIYNRDKSGFYSPKDPSNFSIANPDKRELHFVAHTTEGDKGNFPPHTVWIHLNFTDVQDVS